MRRLRAVVCALSLLLLVSCHSDTPDPVVEECQRTVLVYIVATNTLSGNEERDMAEMLEGIEIAGNSQCRWLVYLRSYNQLPALYEIVSNKGVGEKRLLKSYSSTPLSTTVERMSEVLEDMRQLAPAKEYGLVLWSHALAWEPASSASAAKTSGSGMSKYSFGEDRGDGTTAASKMDICDLASAIPSQLLDFIWMDCCYMGSVEVAYQLRDKCRYYIAYPTEVLSAGAPYQLTMPYLLGENADVTGAAKAMFDYYDGLSGIQRSATIAVYDMSVIEQLADAAHAIMQRYQSISTDGLQRYTRGSNGPYYDLEDYMKRQAEANGSGEEATTALHEALESFVVYKDATPGMLGSFAIDKERYSGVSVHPYEDDGSYRNVYYATLDWYKRVF